jgi:TetR/AcrR family transcriptional regulator
VEFAQEGLAGARMDAIAEAAAVNKALLYYYFKDKETLYGEILDRFFAKLAERIMTVCHQPGSAGHRFLSYARTHFDSVAESPYYAHIFMSELMSAGRGGSTHLDRIFAKYMKPIGGGVLGLLQEGIASGEFRAVDPNQFLPSAIGSIVHYFLTAPLRQKFVPEHYTPREQVIPQRRAAVLDFIAAALFTNREAGIALAAHIAALPAASFRGDSAAPRRRRVVAPPAPESTPTQAQPPTAPTNPAAAPPPPPVGYRWMDRWFPDFETARRIMREEKRLGLTDKRKLPSNLDEEFPE